MHPWINCKPNTASPNWKNLCSLMSNIKSGVSKSVESGSSINTCKDPWIENILISKWPTFINAGFINDYSKVYDFINNFAWILHDFSLCFHTSLVKRIISIHISNSPIDDSWIWSFTPSDKASSINNTYR